MNLSTGFGFFVAGAVVWFTVIEPSPNPDMLLDLKSMLLVLGGTVAVAFIIFPFSQLLGLAKMLIFGVALKRGTDRRRLVKEIVSAALVATDSGSPHALTLCPASHPFLGEGLQLIAEDKLANDDLREVLTRRSQFFKQAYMAHAKMLAVLAKFPSSLGMLGSTVGLIDMMSGLGAMGQEGIGPAMAMALVTTFWGIVLTYMVVMPLSDYAVRLAAEDSLTRQLIVEGLMMIKRREEPLSILEKLNGFLALKQRLILRRGMQNLSFDEIRREAERIRRRAA